MTGFNVLSSNRDRVGESPVWSVAEQALYWVDIEGCKLHRFNWAQQTQHTWELFQRVGCIALSNRGSVIAAMQDGMYELQLSQTDSSIARSTLLASVPHHAANMRFNDGRCDTLGRFWAGTMVMDMGLASAQGRLYCLDINGLSAPKQDDLITPNGLAFSPDTKRMYLSDSHPTRQIIWSYDLDLQNANISNRQTFVDMRLLPGRPDGAAIDQQGCYWICGNDAGLVHQFSPDGVLLQSIPVPTSKPAMCAFGGPELKHLLVTSIQPAQPAPGFDAELAGAVFILQTGAQGRPEPVFTQFPVPVPST